MRKKKSTPPPGAATSRTNALGYLPPVPGPILHGTTQVQLRHLHTSPHPSPQPPPAVQWGGGRGVCVMLPQHLRRERGKGGP